MTIFEAFAPTVKIVAYVPIPMPRGGADAWTWAPLPSADPAGYDYPVSAAETAAVLRCWGIAVSRTLIRSSHDRFALAAISEATDHIVGRHQWGRDSAGVLRPLGQPWVPASTLTPWPSNTRPETPRARAKTL